MNQNPYQNMQDQLDKVTKSVPVIVLFFALIVGGFSSFYTVQPDEEAVIMRLGHYLETNGPGLHFKVPFGVDEKIIIKTKLIHQTEFGFRTVDSTGARTRYSTRNYDNESLMLTGDLNVADVEWVIQYQISDPFKFIFKSRDPKKTIRDVSESIMRRVVGDQIVSEVLTTGRAQIASDAKLLMQEVLNYYDIGITIRAVQLQDVSPPESVKQAFNEVNEAKQEQEKLINEAEEKYNKIIPAAKGKAEEVLSRAEGFAEAAVNRALGDANKFEQVLVSYRKAPSITKKRIYLETMEGIFQGLSNLTIVDSKVKGLLPVYSDKVVGGSK